MLNQYTVSGNAVFNFGENGAFFAFQGEKDNFTFGKVTDCDETISVEGTARITYEGEDLYDFKFIHKVGEYEVSHSFRDESLGNCIDFKITHPSDTLNAVTRKFFGKHKDFMGQIVICRSVEEAMKLYFEFCSMVSQAA